MPKSYKKWYKGKYGVDPKTYPGNIAAVGKEYHASKKIQRATSSKKGSSKVKVGPKGSSVLDFLVMTALSIGIGFTVGLVMGQPPEESIRTAVEEEIKQYTTGEGIGSIFGGMLGGGIAVGVIAANPEIWPVLAAAALIVGLGWLGAEAGKEAWQFGGWLGRSLYDWIHPPSYPYKLGGTWVELKDLGRFRPWPPDPCESNPCFKLAR